jgi:hypothetical protein
MVEKSNMSEEEYLRKHLEGLENKENKGFSSPKVNVQIDNRIISDGDFISFDCSLFPCGIFYPAGSKFQIRPATVKEIQSYSMVDDNNYYDIVEKMDGMLSSCVRIKYSDNKIGSYLDVRGPDRFYLIFLIRELTFQSGSSLVTKTTCTCNSECSIELKRENFKIHGIPDKIKRFFNPSILAFSFKINNGMSYDLAPPTIGLEKSFSEYIIKENGEKRKPNLSFLKIIPFLLYDRNSITQDGIKSKLEEYQKIDDISFQFLNSAVEKLTFGIEGLVKNCSSCGLEVHTDMIFPDGPSAVFVIHDAFEQFIEE